MQLGNYYNTKTVKLNDSYVVYLHNLRQRTDNNKSNRRANTDVWDPYGDLGTEFNILQSSTGGTKYSDSRLTEIMSCTEVNLPVYKYKVESHNYGNLCHKMILPDYSVNQTVSLTFAETEDHQIETLLKLLIRRNIKHGGLADMQYVDNGWLDIIAVDILSNDLHKAVVRYQFGLCRLVNYTVYDLSYANDNLPTYKMQFTFEKYEKQYNPTAESLNQFIRETRNCIEAYNIKPGVATPASQATALIDAANATASEQSNPQNAAKVRDEQAATAKTKTKKQSKPAAKVQKNKPVTKPPTGQNVDPAKSAPQQAPVQDFTNFDAAIKF